MPFHSPCRFYGSAILCGLFTLTLSLACGGGGGGNSGGNPPPPSITVSPAQISVSAGVSDAPPTAQVSITLSTSYSGNLYLFANQGFQGISSLHVGEQGGLTTNVVINFKSPSMLGVGTYTDDLALSVATDSQGKNLLGNSPQHVAVTYTVTTANTTISTLSPTAAIAGGKGFTLTVNGSRFSGSSTILWNGTAKSTHYVSANQLSAQITSGDITSPGTIPVKVVDPYHGDSNTIDFTVNPAAFSINALSPTSMVAGAAPFTLTVTGAQFASNAVIQWNGSALPTTFVSGTRLTAQVPASDITSPGTVSVTVLNPANQGGTSNPLMFTVSGTNPDAVAFQMDPGHSGAVTFNAVTLPTTSLWKATLDGPPSYPLIAQGKVFITCPISGGSELIALDQTTGAVTWGPILIGGPCNATYDAGKVFVASGIGFANGAIMQAFDAGTGKQLWSSSLPGQYAFRSLPVAMNGRVYTTEAGVGTTTYAFDESNGNLLWTQLTDAGDFGGPAVTSSGVYVAGPQEAYAFDPASGELLWSYLQGGDGGGGAIPVVTNSFAFMPDGFGSYSGHVLDPKNGGLKGTFLADYPPAITDTVGYFLQSKTLHGIALDSNTILWSFAGDGSLTTSPIVVNGYVFVGSSTGNLYALDATTGAQLWTKNLGLTIPSGASWTHGIPFSGLGAGNGLLAVPAGNTLTTFRLASMPTVMNLIATWAVAE